MSIPVKRVAAIHDLSGFGRASLTAIIPIISAMGIQVCPIPTAILSTHTGGFTDYKFIDLSEHLQEALSMMLEEGLDHIIKRHRRYRDMVRASIRAMGLDLLAADTEASTAVTAVLAPGRSGANQIRNRMLKRFNIALAGGQLELDDVMFRIGHLGYVRELDLLAVIAALEITMLESGFKLELGAGVNRAQRFISEAED
jgi:aspartate aminotransferase-like enzyme